MLKFVDDIALTVETKEGLQEILRTMEETMNNELHMKIKMKKTKVLVCSRNNYTRVKMYLQGN